MDFMQRIYEKAKSNPKKIVLPETGDIRILKAADVIHKEGYAEVILVGDKEVILKKAKDENINLEGIKIVNPRDDEKREDYIDGYYERRSKKGITKERAQHIVIEDYLFFAAMMVAKGDADGMVAGAERSTADTLRSLLHCVGTEEGISTISSFFSMVMPDKRIFFFADCAVNPNPTSLQLADIAIATADNYKKFMGEEPKVAMLSFSTKGSANHTDVDKVKKAVEKIKEVRPDIEIDGELQFDAAIIEKIGQKKAPDSKVAGKANVLIFPDLDAGNIGYKIAQRLGGADAIGPVIQGGAKPINDLSRGCSVEDIVNVTAITSTQIK